MIEKDILTLRLEGIDNAQQRSRSGFFYLTTAALVVLIVFFNTTFSQVGKPAELKVDPNAPKGPNLTMEELKKEEVKRFFGRFTYALPIVRVQVATDDLVFFAPLALLIFCLYYVSCMRNAARQLEDLSRSLNSIAKNDELESDRLKVKVVLSSGIVLNEPFSELPINLGKSRFFPLGVLSKTVNLYRALIYLPALASGGALYGDIRGTYLNGGVFDTDDRTYWAGLTNIADKAKVVTFETLGLIFTLLVLLYCVAASGYAKETSNLLQSLTTKRPTQE